MPEWRQELLSRIADLNLRPERETEIVDELAQHLDDRVRDLVAGGATPEEATAAAFLDLDTPGELSRRLSEILHRRPLQLPPLGTPARGAWLGSCLHDLRHSVRSLLRTPVFTLTVVAVMALTIGPTTAMLSIGNWLVWRPVPVVQAQDHLGYAIFATWRDGGSFQPDFVSPANIADLLRASSTMEGMAGVQEASESVSVGALPAESIGTAHADANFFSILGLRPAAGRFFAPEEDRLPRGAAVAVVSDAFARRNFGNARDAVGREIRMNRHVLSIVGVAPPSFRGVTAFSAVDVWYPGSSYRWLHYFPDDEQTAQRGTGTFYEFIVRARPGVSFDAISAELAVTAPRLATLFPDANAKFQTVRARVFPGIGSPFERDDNRDLLRRLLLIGAALVMLGCANVANLLIFRGVRRGREYALRIALGASRGRLIQHQLLETCLLTTAGALFGIGIAAAAVPLILSLVMPSVALNTPDLAVPLDVRALAGTLALAIGTGVVAGLIPAWLNTTRVATGGLSQAGRHGTPRGQRLRSGFAAAQLAISLTLVIGALLMVTTFRGLMTTDLGFDPNNVSEHRIDVASLGYGPSEALRYVRDFNAALAVTPGLAASFSTGAPTATSQSVDVRRTGDPDDERIRVRANAITKNYFAVTDIPILTGRGFTAEEELATGDRSGSAAIISQSLARRLFGAAEPLGRRFDVVSGRSVHSVSVAGVVGDIRPKLRRTDLELTVYEPFAREPNTRQTTLLVKSTRPLTEVAALVKAAGGRADANVPVFGQRPFRVWVDQQLSTQRVFAWVLSLLGGLGLVLAAIGLYGLLSQSVAERTREFGIRMAIGASRRHVIALVARHAAVIGVIGAGAGLPLAFFGARVLESQLTGISAHDPRAYVAAALALFAVVLVAAALPARTATRVQPIEALRMD
ncbi:MAG: ADOP family duplicated permease [Vicinamibacterales bacterium]